MLRRIVLLTAVSVFCVAQIADAGPKKGGVTIKGNAVQTTVVGKNTNMAIGSFQPSCRVHLPNFI
jgi:hypothetical protein